MVFDALLHRNSRGFNMTKLITDAGALTKAIAAASAAGHKLDASVQIVLASAVYFALKDGNIQPINAMFTSASKGMRKAAIQAWLLDHAPVALNTNKTTAKEQPFVFVRDAVAVLTDSTEPVTAELAEAVAMKSLSIAWTDYKPEQLIPESFDLQAMVAALVKKAKGLQAKGSKPKHGDLLAGLEAMTATAEPASL
jgi:hypothetical protein